MVSHSGLSIYHDHAGNRVLVTCKGRRGSRDRLPGTDYCDHQNLGRGVAGGTKIVFADEHGGVPSVIRNSERDDLVLPMSFFVQQLVDLVVCIS